MTFVNFLFDVTETMTKYPTLRLGQTIMNRLYDCNINKYKAILETEYDCFYLDSVVPKTLKKLEEEWE